MLLSTDTDPKQHNSSIKTHSERLSYDFEKIDEDIGLLALMYKSQDSQLRKAVLELLKKLCDDVYEQAETDLLKTGKGRVCAENLSLFQDQLIQIIYNFTLEHIYPAMNPSSGERLAIIATGGYGRGLLAPGSDIDLMFLLPYKQTAWGESMVEYILYFLWDLGFKVGHATRTLDQAIRLSKTDFTIRTALLDARLILGDHELFTNFSKRFDADVVQGTGAEFIEAKLDERNTRHERTGRSRYRVEPNIKDGKGGLRDLHTLYWIAKYISEGKDSSDFVEAGIFSPQEYRQFVRCENFLWTVRCHLHFMTGRPEERLTFDVQEEVAQRLKYKGQNGLRAVERFMRHYFLVAKKVGALTRVVCASMEMKQQKKKGSLEYLLSFFHKEQGPDFEAEGYKLEHGRLTVTHKFLFRKNPVELIRLFYIAEKYKLNFHPEVLRLVHSSFRFIDDKLRGNKEANRLFLELLCSPSNSESALRKMNEAGVLGRFIPDFGRVVSMMQFNMYHHYTVDEHLITSIGMLNQIETGQSVDEHPIATEVFATIKNRKALYVATLLHDIAKGRDEDHSIVGAKIAKVLCPRLGLSPSETELVSWLIKNHLVMSKFAQNRDLQDPKTITDFADIVKTKERLDLLLILTVADIRAVGPGVWNAWKRQLLSTLYVQTKTALSDEHSTENEGRQIIHAKQALKKALPDWSEQDFFDFADKHYSDYWLRVDDKTLLKHAQLVKRYYSQSDEFAIDIDTDTHLGVTELTIFTPNRQQLLVRITGACVLADADIVEAQIYTTRDNYALDTILIRRSFDRLDDETRKIKKISNTLKKFLSGEKILKDVMPTSYKPVGRKKVFTVEPQVKIDNSLSDSFSVIEIRSLDRPGLLFHITQSLNALDLDISSAHISTFGEQAVDTFYVTDAKGHQLKDHLQIRIIERHIMSFLGEKSGL